MGDVIFLADRRAELSAGAGACPASPESCSTRAFYFDLASPFTYLAAERIERLLGRVHWRPALTFPVAAQAGVDDRRAATARVRVAAERRAEALGMPLSWPERFPAPARAAMRAAAYAAECNRGDAFALAASRLAYCGGFDLDDPEVLAEAAAAAGIGLASCLRAAGDVRRDAELEAARRRVVAAGGDRLPAVRVGRVLFCGEERIVEAAAAAHAPAPARRRRRATI